MNRQKTTKTSKVFCIGFNKTGTTSLEYFMKKNGFICGNQSQGELLINAYATNLWREIIDFCHTAEFFQDLPFSAPKTAEVLLHNFPDAKFILTIRGSADEWYRSITEFHKIKFGKYGSLPSKKDLMGAGYRYKGFAWDANRALYDSPPNDPYNRKSLIDAYNNHITNVREIFKGKGNLLIIDISKPDTVEKLNSFLEIKSTVKIMPWLNKTSDVIK